jgi:hypothetical protein
MAETVTIEGQEYLARNPWGVAGLSLITLGIYWFYWYYKINDELRRFSHDESINPTRSLMAVLFGWIIIVPPFIAMWNTAKHIEASEGRVGVTNAIEPVLVIVIIFVLSIANGVYMQEHLNRVWTAAQGGNPLSGGAPASTPIPPPPAPTG